MSIDVLARAWKHSHQSGSTLLALLALASMAHDDGVLWMRGVTVAYIGTKARTKERQTQSNLRALESSGEIYAPPAAGRGRTTRYFVTIGLSEDEIRAVLTLEYELSPIEAARIAAETIRRQKVQQSAPFDADTPALETDEPPKKVQRSAPIQKVQRTAPMNGKGAVQRHEKVQSSVKKGAIQRHENGTFDALERAISDPIRHDPNHDHDPTPTHDHDSRANGDGVGDSYKTEVRALLGGYGILAAGKIATQYAALMVRPSLDEIRAAIESVPNPDDEPRIKGQIATRLMDSPPPWPTMRPRGAPKGAPLTATKPNIPETPVTPAEMLRQIRARHDSS